jgi:triosephosphate isomerase (TIM)
LTFDLAMRQPLIAGNWKMFKTVQQTVFYIKELRGLVNNVRDVEVVVAPPFTSIHAAAEAARNSNIAIAGQDLYWEREGPFTGEVSGPIIREAGAELVIIGHSERRTLFGETDATVNRKLGAGIAAGLIPIVCIGESLEQREANQTLDVLDGQVRRGLDNVTSSQLAELLIAYEPVWAIGTGRNATPEQAQEAHAHIRTRLRQWFGAEAADRCHILYGGSVKTDNIAALMTQPDVDGALVGGASLDVRAFAEIIQKARR